MPHVRRLGLEGEDAAAEFLAAQGYTLLTRRFKASSGEVDLVGLEGSVLAFIEVKRRLSGFNPAEAITAGKRERIFAAARAYLSRWDGPECEVRYDVVAVTPSGIRLHRDAFRP